METKNAEEVAGRLRTIDRVAVLTGAGISAESGLATFRASDGLWEGHHVEDVASPEGFERDPKLVWDFYDMRRVQAAAAMPNAAHTTLAEWQERFENLTIVTQNVDGLHHRAGSENVLELHGTLWIIECRNCGTRREDRVTPLPQSPPICSNCGGMERPSIVWFGEGLPEHVWSASVDAVQSCDVLLVIGTSAQVYPAAGLVPFARRHGATVIEINPDSTGMTSVADFVLRAKAGEAMLAIDALLRSSRD